MRAELGVTVGDLPPGLLTSGVIAVGVLGVLKFPHRLPERAWAELAREPAVEARQELIFAKVDGPGVVGLVLGGVLAEEDAPVISSIVVPAALHPPAADAAEEQPAQRVRARGAPRRALRPAAPGAPAGLHVLVRLDADQRLVHGLVRPDPLARLIPALLGDKSLRDVGHVQQYLVFALPVPDLPAGVPGVVQDGGDRAPRPGDAAAVPVAARIVRGRAGYAVTGQALGYRLQPAAGQVFGEDPLDDVGRLGFGCKGMQPLPIDCLGRVRVRAGVDQRVTVGRSSAQKAAFELSLRGHGGADPDLDAVPLTFRDPAEHGHDQVVGLVVRVDRSADLRNPQRYAVVREYRERVAELVAIESPLRLPHDHGFEPAVGIGEGGQEPAGLRPALRRDRAGLVDVEELGDDLPAVRGDQGLGAGELPGTGRLGVLVVLGGDPSPER